MYTKVECFYVLACCLTSLFIILLRIYVTALVYFCRVLLCFVPSVSFWDPSLGTWGCKSFHPVSWLASMHTASLSLYISWWVFFKKNHFMMSWWAKTFFQILVLLPVVILRWPFFTISLPFIALHLGLILFGTNHLLSVLILRIDFGDHCLLQSPALLCARFEHQFHVLFTIYSVPMVCDAKLSCIQLATVH